MRKVNLFLLSVVSVVFGSYGALGRDSRRPVKLSVKDVSGNSGLVVKGGMDRSRAVSFGSNRSSCGQNAQMNAAGTSCECKDPVNYVLNSVNSTECLLRTDPIVVAQKKACGSAFLRAVDEVCRDSAKNNGLSSSDVPGYEPLKCYDANDLFLKLDTAGINVMVDGTSYSYDKVCYLYAEELAKSVAEAYQISGPNSPNCKLKRVVAEASNECYQMVLSAGKKAGATDEIAGDLRKTCGVSGLALKWSRLFGTDDSSTAVVFPTNIPDLYLNAGKVSMADGMEALGNFLDLKITDKTKTWERDITNILNSHLAEVGAACGKEYEVALHNVNYQLLDERSSLERSVGDKGLVKGLTDWGIDQFSIVQGEKWAKKVKDGGFAGNSTVDDTDSVGAINRVVDLTSLETSEFNAKYNEFTAKGKFVVITNDEFVIINVTDNDDDESVLNVEKIEYGDGLQVDLTKDVLKKLIGKKEKQELSVKTISVSVQSN